MNTESPHLPFKEYSSSLSRYSDNNQLEAYQYKSILESELGQAFYQREFSDISDAALGPLNANLPRYNNQYTININNKHNIDVYKEFWQYKQPGGSIFTDWDSAGISAVKEDMAVRDLPLHGKISDPTLVLSNTNNVRNNLQNYAKEYLTTTNMLNAEAFANGVFYESGGTSPYRTGTRYELEQIEHGNFKNNEDGDLYSRQIKQLRVDLPINYANNNVTSWNYINPICIIPNKRLKVFHEQLKYGIFDLDSMKLIGTSCLTASFGMMPQGFDHPVDVVNDDTNYPPLCNTNYYNSGPNHLKCNKDTDGSNLYCSANTNFVAMPMNHAPRLKNLDSSFQVSPGNNSVTLGTVMSTRLKNFINNDLFKFNRALIVMKIYSQEIVKVKIENPFVHVNKLPKTHLMKKIERHYPHLFLNHHDHHKSINFEYYMGLSEGNKYTWIFNQQRNFAATAQGYPELEIFVNHLSIFKFGGHNINNPLQIGKVRLKELLDSDIPISRPGCFLLLPTMLSEDLFTVRQNIPSDYNKLPRNLHDDSNNCISPDANYQENATNCAFRGKASMWQQKPKAGESNPNFVPNMFNDPNNYNNDIYNLKNPYVGTNRYDAPDSF